MEIINYETLAMLEKLDVELAKAYAKRCINAPEPSKEEKEASKQTFVFNGGTQTLNVNCNIIKTGKSSNRKTNSSSNASSDASSSSNKPGNPAPPPSDPTPPPPVDPNEAEALNEDTDSADDDTVDEAEELQVNISNDDLDTVPSFII